jgi:hexokinase
LVLTDEKLVEIRDRMLTEIVKGLNKETNAEATIKCFPTYVRELPNGEGKIIMMYFF